MAKQAKHKRSTRKVCALTEAIPAHIRDCGLIGRVAIPATAQIPRDPGAYILIADGNCCAPFIQHDDKIIMSPATKAEAGDFVHIAMKNGEHRLKRLTHALPPYFDQNPQDEVEFLVCFEMLSPPRHFFIPARTVKSVYPCVGLLRDGEFHPVPRAGTESGAEQ